MMKECKDSGSIYDELVRMIDNNISDYQFMRFNNSYYGLDQNNFFVYAVESEDKKSLNFTQHTNLLLLQTNVDMTLVNDNNKNTKKMHLLICKSDNDCELKSFIRLTAAFNDKSHTSDNIISLFNSLINLFSRRKNVIDANGLYGELYLMYYLVNKGVDIYPYWQKKSKMKFDFTLTKEKRIEVKTSVKERKHHFIHEQLDHSNYNIYICSVLLRKGDFGLNLFDLINFARDKYNFDFEHLFIIEEITNNYSEAELKSISYDEQYTENNIGFYKAEDIPSIPFRKMDNISKINYESDLTHLEVADIDSVIEWINKK